MNSRGDESSEVVSSEEKCESRAQDTTSAQSSTEKSMNSADDTEASTSSETAQEGTSEQQPRITSSNRKRCASDDGTADNNDNRKRSKNLTLVKIVDSNENDAADRVVEKSAADRGDRGTRESSLEYCEEIPSQRSISNTSINVVDNDSDMSNKQDLGSARSQNAPVIASSSSILPIPLDYLTEVCEIKRALRSVYDNINMGWLNKRFRQSVLSQIQINADFPVSILNYDLKPFVPKALREKHSLQIERHLRAALSKEQQEKRTLYIIRAGADEILLKLHKPDPAGLRLVCGTLFKRISCARGWLENLPTIDDIYRVVVDLDVDELLDMGENLSVQRPIVIKNTFKNGNVGALRSDFVINTLKQLNVSHNNPTDIQSMNIRWVVPMEIVAINTAVDTICSQMRTAVEVAQLNDRIEFFIAYHANDLLGMRIEKGKYLDEQKISKMLYEVIAVNEWKSKIPSLSVIISRINAIPTHTLAKLCIEPNARTARNIKKAIRKSRQEKEEEMCDLMVIWDDAIRYSFT